MQIWGKQNQVVITDGLKLRSGFKFSSKHCCVYISRDNPPAKLGPSWKAQEGHFQMLDLGLSTSQANIQSCFKQCGRANLLKGLTQPCCPQGNVYGRAVNASRAALVTAQPCAGYVSLFCSFQAAPSQLIYCHTTQLAGGESGPVVTEQTQGWCLVCSPSLPASKGNLKLWRRRGKEEKQGYFLERQSHS